MFGGFLHESCVPFNFALLENSARVLFNLALAVVSNTQGSW